MSGGKTILLIDDEIILREIIKIALQVQGYTVIEAGNGLEGLEKLKSIEPTLIILDMNMPKMGGFEFYKVICGNKDRPPYPIMVLTAHAHLEKLFREIPIDGFMTKPFEIDQLLREINMIVQKRLKSQDKTGKSTSNILSSLNVCVVDSNPEALEKISSCLRTGGFNVHCHESGLQAIEYISEHVPDAAMISLKLPDISGDIVIQRLKYMAKTQDVKYIMYLKELAEKTIVTYHIAQKSGINHFVDTNNPEALLKAVNEVLGIKK